MRQLMVTAPLATPARASRWLRSAGLDRNHIAGKKHEQALLTRGPDQGAGSERTAPKMPLNPTTSAMDQNGSSAKTLINFKKFGSGGRDRTYDQLINSEFQQVFTASHRLSDSVQDQHVVWKSRT